MIVHSTAAFVTKFNTHSRNPIHCTTCPRREIVLDKSASYFQCHALYHRSHGLGDDVGLNDDGCDEAKKEVRK